MFYRLNEEKMFMDISDGIAVVINSETGIYYGMNAFGTSVFDALIKGMNSDLLLSSVKALNNAPSDAEEKCLCFIERLCSYELIVPSEEKGIDGYDFSSAVSDDFTPEVSAFDDAQEMLLADPIHEVKEETGWSPEKASIGYSREETKKREAKVK